MLTEMQTVNTTTDYHVVASDQLVFTNHAAFHLSQPIAGNQYVSPSPHLTISGEVDVVMTSVSAVGASGIGGIIIDNTLDSRPAVTVDPGGILKVTASGGSAIGYAGGGNAGPTFENAGAVIVSAEGDATGLLNIANTGALTNSGQVTVTSATSDATGLKMYSTYRVQVLNSGSITVTGHNRVVGVDMGSSGTGEVFHNTGTIVARDDSATQTSIGVIWGNGPQPGLLGSFINDGTIEADRALDVEMGYGTAAENLITNNGRLVGAVWLGGGAPETLVNNGVITGPIRMIGGGSVYDGRLGLALGPIVGSNNTGNTFLGGAGAETMTGGFPNDTVSGGGGDDLIDGGDGFNQLDGGPGLNTLSFASVSGGVQVDLAAGRAQLANGADTFTGFTNVLGSPWSDTIMGDATGNRLDGGAGNDSLSGRDGNDFIVGGAGANYLRGDDGEDTIYGGSGFDDINGNKGDDVIDGGAGGGDWLVGGQGNDLIDAHASDNILYGNLGNDTLNGGTGNEIVRGGQADDVIAGGAGNDWMSGDRGDDTVTGGAGADIFHGSQDAGIDRVTDFSLAEGDRVQLDPGTIYTLREAGADTVIDMGGGHQMVLVGVQLSSLTPGWIFGA